MTAQQLAYEGLSYIGEYSITLTEYTGTASTGVFRALMNAANSAQQELFETNPALFKREVGATVLAPQTGTVAVTNGSTAVSATSFTSPLHGNTLLIAGQSEYNAIRTEGASTKLLFPYTGPTGTQTATLYGDAVLLDSAFSRPLGPVWLSDIRILTPLAGKAALLGYDPGQNLEHTDWGRVPAGYRRSVQPRTIAQPEAYFADVHLLESGASSIRLFLTPLPDIAYSLRFDAGVRPLAVTVANFGSEGTDPARNFALPAGLDERFLLPLFLYHWSRSTFFKNADARARFREDRPALLAEIEAWKPQPQTGGVIVTGGWR
jgi:hypothetical protein